MKRYLIRTLILILVCCICLISASCKGARHEGEEQILSMPFTQKNT